MSYAKYNNLGRSSEELVDPNILNAVVKVQNTAHKQHLVSNNKVCVINVSAGWCGPCKDLAPKYAILSQNYNREGVCNLAKENVDEQISFQEAPPVTGVPTFQIFYNGQFHSDIVGADISLVEQTIRNLLQLK